MYKNINKLKKGNKIISAIVIVMFLLALPGLKSLKVDAKSSDFVIDNFSSTLISYEGDDKIVEIPKGVKKIDFFAFEGNNKMEKLILPKGLLEIDSYAFSGCINLKEIVFPSTLKTINDFAFSGCESLKKIVLPEGLTKVMEFAFSNCTNLEKVSFPSTLKTIEWATFSDCYNLKNVIIKDGTEKIKESAFAYCNIKELKLPSTLKYFDGYAISGCENLKKINIPKNCTVYNWEYINEENSIESINVDHQNKKYMSIDGVVLSKDGKSIIFYSQYKKDESYTIPDSVRYIENAKFYKTNYLKHLIFGKNVIWEDPSDTNYGSYFMNGILEGITVPATNKTFCDVNGVLFTKDKKTLVLYPEGKTDDIYVVPKGTEKLNIYSFSMNYHVEWSNRNKPKYLFIPPSVTAIDDYGDAGDEYEFLFDENDAKLKIYGEKGSAAENFANGANELGVKFEFKTLESSNKDQIVLTENQIFMCPGNTFNLYAVSIPSYKIVPVTCKSSDESIISTKKNGEIVSKNFGTAEVIASAENYESVICNVFVKLD